MVALDVPLPSATCWYVRPDRSIRPRAWSLPEIFVICLSSCPWALVSAWFQHGFTGVWVLGLDLPLVSWHGVVNGGDDNMRRIPPRQPDVKIHFPPRRGNIIRDRSVPGGTKAHDCADCHDVSRNVTD